MTWTKLSDDFTDDCWTLSDQAYRLHSEGLIWSNRKLLNLQIPKDDVRRFSKHPEAVTELLAGSWWTDRGDYFEILHHARYQRERDAVIKQQTVNRENRAKRGQASLPARELVTFTTSNDSLNDSSYEMDRTGQAGIKELPQPENISVNPRTGEVTDLGGVTTWQVAEIPNSTSSDHDLCRVCGNSLVSPSSRSTGLCLRGNAEHVAAREQFKEVA